jgi:hypothetical protein
MLVQQAKAILVGQGLPPLQFWEFQRPIPELKQELHDAIEKMELSEDEEQELLIQLFNLAANNPSQKAVIEKLLKKSVLRKQRQEKINKLLEESGWRFFDNTEGKANIVLEPKVKLTKAATVGKGKVVFFGMDKNLLDLLAITRLDKGMSLSKSQADAVKVLQEV